METTREFEGPEAVARYLRAVRCEELEAAADAAEFAAEVRRDELVVMPLTLPATCLVEGCGGDAYRMLLAVTGEPADVWECEECGAETTDGDMLAAWQAHCDDVDRLERLRHEYPAG